MNTNKTIFLSIASQDDEELKHTLQNAFTNAHNPERVYAGVGLTAMHSKTLRDLKKISKNNKRVSYTFTKQRKNDISTLGIGKGRSKAASLYKNQDYFIQIDSHTFLSKGWDANLINLYEEARQDLDLEKFVISNIPAVYKYCCHKHKDPIKAEPDSRYPYFMTHSFFVDSVPRWKEFAIYNFRDEMFLPVAKVSPAFIMGDSKFGRNTGIHPNAIFYDEDFTQSANLFGNGFSFVFLNIDDFPVRHLDSNGIVKGHSRYFFLDYLNQENNKKIHEKLKEEYYKFVNDPKNKETLSRYRQYSKVDPIKGCFTTNADIVPETFNNTGEGS